MNHPKVITVYEKSTGRVISSGISCIPDNPDESFLPSGCAILIGVDANPGSSYISNGVAVNMPPRPSEAHDFFYPTKQWVCNADKAWSLVRMQRDRKLKDTDWMVTKASETGSPIPTDWSSYRQALRDITTQTDPMNIVWPTPPSN